MEELLIWDRGSEEDEKVTCQINDAINVEKWTRGQQEMVLNQ